MHAETSVQMGNNSQVYSDDEDDRVNDHCEHDRISALILSVAIIIIRCNARRDLCAHWKQQPGCDDEDDDNDRDDNHGDHDLYMMMMMIKIMILTITMLLVLVRVTVKVIMIIIALILIVAIIIM